MERRTKVELFERIRREYEFGVGSIKGVAAKLGVHRRMVRQALASAETPERKLVERVRPVMGPLAPFIEAILEADRRAPRKQRHTAHRIWQRILAERPERKVAEVTVRQYVRERKAKLGWALRETCVPQSYQLGQEAQVDSYEAWAELSGEQVLLQVFAMRSMASGAAFHRAYPRATQQAFLDAHEHAFSYFGGVFRTLRYDNLASAVKKILRGRQRVETERVIAFRSHWGFQSEYCNPASGNEKGGVEGELGWYRRNWLVPVPEAEDLESLNRQLLAACIASRNRTIIGRNMTIAEACRIEQPHLLALAEENFGIHETLYPLIVDGKGRVKVKTNWYSAPLWPGLRVTARVWPSLIEIEHDGKCMARHPRHYGRGCQILALEHYLDVLEKKPGAMAGSAPLEQWRQAGRWPECLDRIWHQLEQRHGKSVGTREMITLVRAGSGKGWDQLIAAVEEVLRLGVTDAAAVLHILNMPDPEQRRRYSLDLA